MINLIPNEEKKKNKKDFYFRFFVMFFVFLCFSIFILVIAILPSYVVSLDNKTSLIQKLEKQKKEIMPETSNIVTESMKDLDSKLYLLEQARKNNYFFSKKVIDEILGKKVSGIKINSFFYVNDLGGRKVNIVGVARDREQLLLFRKTLENNSSFQKVDLPISNFVKGQDIDFNLNLISI